MILIGIDPGSTESAYVIYDGKEILEHGKIPNDQLLQRLSGSLISNSVENIQEYCAIEQIRGFGIVAGNELFDTVFWSGRFAEAFDYRYVTLIPRKTIVAHLCETAKATDADVRAAICYRFGGKEKAIGKVTKKINQPGPLFGITKDTWSALAVCLYWWDHRREQAGRV